MWFAVTLEQADDWDYGRGRREQDGWDAHADFMDGLVADGFIVLGGPLEDGPEILHAIRAGSEDEVRARLAEDPWAPRLLRVRSVRAWDVLLDGTGSNPG